MTNVDKRAYIKARFLVLIPAMDIQTLEPSVITAGDTIQWSRSLPDYPASAGWTLKYALRGPAVIDIVADATQLVTVAASASSAWVAGDYFIQGFVVKGTSQYTVYSGRITINPNLALAGANYDGRSHAKRVLDAIEAVIEGRASRGDQETTIDGTRLVKMTAEQLRGLRSYYRNEYQSELRRENVKNGKRSGRRVLVRFNP